MALVSGCPPPAPSPAAVYRRFARTLLVAGKPEILFHSLISMTVFEGYVVKKRNIGRPEREILALVVHSSTKIRTWIMLSIS
jgi:hypothetical protein